MAHPPSLGGRRTRSRTLSTLCVVALLGLLALAAGPLAPAARAEPSGRAITIGETNSRQQRAQMLRSFDATDADRVSIVTLDEAKAVTADIFGDETTITSAHSSTVLACEDPGDGLSVETRNVTSVPPALYAMALATAGIDDATLVVAAPDGATAEGVAALAGVFKSWASAPCASGATSPARQRLAMEAVMRTAGIGQELAAAGADDGVRRAAGVVLGTQQAIVAEGLVGEAEIDAALAAQERAAGIAVPARRRDRLVDFLTRLAGADLDWGTFGNGWRIETTAEGTRLGISPRGARPPEPRAAAPATGKETPAATAARPEPAANRPAAAAATALMGVARSARTMVSSEARRIGPALGVGADVAAAVQAVVATAAERAAANRAAAAEAAMTATAQAAVEQAATAAAASATQEAMAALTATAAAQPTATPIPTATPPPTATATPVEIAGTVVDERDGLVVIRQSGRPESPVAYAVDPAASVTRDGRPVSLDAVENGDAVRGEVDGTTRLVTVLSAEAAEKNEAAQRFRTPWMILLLGLVAPGALWIRRRRADEPFVVTPRAARSSK